MKRIDLNVDIGEGFPFDADLLIFATSASICCGEHAGSWDLTQETIGLSLESGVRIGMHPGYPDRIHMGRVSMKPEQRDEFAFSVRRQIDQFFNFVPAAYLKPHGALYSDSQDGLHPMAMELMEACGRFGLPLLGMPGTAHEGLGSGFLAEGFADRRYTASRRLVPRGEPGAVLADPSEIRRQVLELATTVDSICIHGDTPDCLSIAEIVYAALIDAGFEVAS